MIKINPGFRSGIVTAPPSKSLAHRALICAGLCENYENDESNILNIDLSEDISATIGAMKVLKERGGMINCKESGSTLRFLLPVAAALGLSMTFAGEGRLPERPVVIYQELFKDKGVDLELNNGKLPVKISGKLLAGKFYIPGNISSQFISGLLFALPLLTGDSEVILTSELESEPYVNMTIDVLNAFGILINQNRKNKNKNGYEIKGGQKYKRYKSTNFTTEDFTIEGDYSQAAFFACAAAINGDIKIYGLTPKTLQGDFKIINILREFGVTIDFRENILHVKKCGNLRGIKIDGSQIPDIVPVLAVVAVYAQGESVIYNAKRLKLKESDRIHSVYEMLTAIGVEVRKTDDGLIINGGKKLSGGFVKSCNDHRIAMSAAVAAVGTENGVIIDDMSCINKSYPGFLKDFNHLCF